MTKTVTLGRAIGTSEVERERMDNFNVSLFSVKYQSTCLGVVLNRIGTVVFCAACTHTEKWRFYARHVGQLAQHGTAQ